MSQPAQAASISTEPAIPENETDQEETQDVQMHTTIISSLDIGHALNDMKSAKLSDSVLKQVLTNRWEPIKKGDFPFSKSKRQGGKIGNRYINSDHLRKFKWLGVSKFDDPSINGVWCVYCVFFKTTDSGGGRGANASRGGGQKMGKLVNSPLLDYSDLTGSKGTLTKHESSNFHTMCKLKVDEFLQRCKQGSYKDVRNLIDEERKKQCLENREALKPIIETILLCSRQNIAFRGHRDDGPICTDGEEPEINDGNFRSLLRYRIRGGDAILKQHLDTANHNSMYTSKTIQNELISIAAQLILKSIANDVNNAQFWAIIADETQDRAKREQLVIVVRYISVDKNKCKYNLMEEPIKMLDLIKDIKSRKEESEHSEVKLSGEAIGKTIINAVNDIGLNFGYLVGQGYDGASAMASERIGVAAIVKEIAVLADYFHCAMHSLNLSATQTSKVPEIRHCLDVIRDMCNFFKYAKRKSYLEEKIKDNTEGVKKTKLVSLCQTRFVEKHESVMVAKILLPFVVASLSDMATWDSFETRNSASKLLGSIQKPNFLIGLIMLEKVSGIIRPVSVILQAKENDLFSALDDIDNMLKLLQKHRNSGADEFNNMFQETLVLAEKVGVEKEEINKKPRIIKISAYRANAGS